MADHRKKVECDDVRLNIDSDHEMKHWAKKFGVSQNELRAAIAKAGPVVRDIRVYAKRPRSSETA
jgi:hypothetical protein